METKTKSVMIVISYGGTLRALARGDFGIEELSGALFYVGCSREWLMDEYSASVELKYNGLSGNRQKLDLYRAFREAVVKAETEGRVAWAAAGGNTWRELNELLAQNGLEELPVDPDFPKEGRYSYPSVVEAVRQDGLPYRVIWH